MDTENSFAGLINPIKRRMFETVWRILRHSQDAEDALQNALTTVWQQRSRIAGHAAPQALVLKICADAAIDPHAPSAVATALRVLCRFLEEAGARAGLAAAVPPVFGNGRALDCSFAFTCAGVSAG